MKRGERWRSCYRSCLTQSLGNRSWSRSELLWQKKMHKTYLLENSRKQRWEKLNVSRMFVYRTSLQVTYHDTCMCCSLKYTRFLSGSSLYGCTMEYNTLVRNHVIYSHLLFFTDELASRKGWEKNSSANNTRGNVTSRILWKRRIDFCADNTHTHTHTHMHSVLLCGWYFIISHFFIEWKRHIHRNISQVCCLGN